MTSLKSRLAGAALPAILVTCLALAAGAAEAPEQPVGLDRQTGMAVTIYNENLALVKDRRRVDLAQGRNRLAFIDVSGQIKTETALFSGADLAVIEQNFDFDLLTPGKLLEKGVGERVRIIRTNPETGVETVEEGTILSTVDGLVVQIGDRIEIAPPGRIVFASVPPQLRARPTLVLEVDAAATGTADLDLSYLTGGLGWRADYVAELSPDESVLALGGWVTLTNTSGTTYRDAALQLVAGEVNLVQPPIDLRMREDMVVAAPASRPMREEALFEYHLYSLDRPTTIADNQTKQVALLSADRVKVGKEYRFVRAVGENDLRSIEPERINATVRLAFDNSEAGGLGQPLPKGIVRVYKADSSDRVVFVGEDEIDHTPKGETVRLDLGQAFDITATTRQTDFERLSDTSWEAAYEMVVRNAKPLAITVSVIEQLPGEWRILQESQAHERRDAHTAAWSVAVPAAGEAKLAYRVRVTY